MKTSLSLLLKKRNRFLSSLAFGVFVLANSFNAYSQSCSATNFGTVGSAVTCLDFDATPSGAGSSAGCTGSGFGGSGTARIIQFCTNASNQCVSFDFSGLASANGTEISLWTTCSAGALSGYVTNSINCYSGSTAVGWSTAGQATTANTCYYLRVWTKDPPTGTATVCANVESPTNDFCTAPQQIGTAPATYDNYCMTAGTAGDPAPAQFCAGSLENNAWFSFTTLSTCTFPCTVTINITGINCTGGGSGFQIGYWTGVCGALSNIGCTSGAGGSVTATINNLSPNQTVLVGIDGNAGAYCNFSISGTNITPLPVTFIDFSGFRKSYGVEMKCQTLSEKNNAFYTIERSRDLQNWTEIHREYVVGDTFGLTEYQMVDYKAPELDLLYYRLTQTDLNGTATVLKMISMEETTFNNRMKVIPNPVNEEPTFVSIEWDYDTFGTFVVKDTQGKELLSKKASLMRGVNMVKLEMETLRPGLYMVEFSNNESKQMTKFIKL